MEFLLVLLALALAVAIAFGIVVLVTGNDPGLVRLADGVPNDLPSDRPLSESDVLSTTFDTGARGYRTAQVDDALARVAYDVGFKDELIKVLASEVTALRDGRTDEADALRDVRRRALGEPTETATEDGEGAPRPEAEEPERPEENGEAKDADEEATE